MRYRTTVRKYDGDDRASWAILVDGRPVVTGLLRSEVAYHRRRVEELLAQKGEPR